MMKRLLLTTLGAVMILLSMYLVFEKKAGTVAASAPLVVAFAALIAMGILPKKEPKPFYETIEEVKVTILKVLSNIHKIDLVVIILTVISVAVAITLLPKGIIVFLSLVAIVGISGLWVTLRLGKKK
jgi:hypothetical protein